MRRHIPVPLKEQMVIMYLLHRIPISKVAQLMDVHPSTVRRAVKKMQMTGSIATPPLQIGRQRALSGIDCAVGPITHSCFFGAQTDRIRIG